MVGRERECGLVCSQEKDTRLECQCGVQGSVQSFGFFHDRRLNVGEFDHVG